MQIKPQQLKQQLQKGFPPCILLFGDEPFQNVQAIDAIRKLAVQQGFAERQTFTADSEFTWETLIEATQTMSLFSDKQLIELHLPTGKPGKVGGQTLIAAVENASEDVLIILTGPKAGRDIQNTKWFKTLSQAGIFVPFYAYSGQQLVQWVGQIMQEQGLHFSPEVPPFIANACEGNMLAGYQEVQKLQLLYPQTQITLAICKDAVVEQSRFTIFQLTDLVIQGDGQAAVKMLYRLESEGVEPNAIIWQLIKEWQTLYQVKLAPHNINWRALGVWGNQQGQYENAARRISEAQLLEAQKHLAHADFIFKNQTIAKPYVLLAHLCLLLTGQPVPELEPF